jgi:hypothetical protein
MAASNNPVPPRSPGSASERGAETRAGVEAVETYNQVDAVETYLDKHHNGPWHLTLNNHASTRPKIYGGPLVPSVSNCKTFAPPGSASAAWRCSLDLPHSFTPDDGRRLEATGYGKTKEQASEVACRRAMALLLMTSPGEVVLRPTHWWISPSSLLEGLPGTDVVHQALPVHVPARSLEAGVDAARLTEAEVNDRVATLLRRCLRAHEGSFDPARISRRALDQEPDEEPVYSQLNKLLERNQLRTFVDSHPEFSWSVAPWSSLGLGMVITWALDAPPLAPSSASADQALLALPAPAISFLEQALVGQRREAGQGANAAAAAGCKPASDLVACLRDEQGEETNAQRNAAASSQRYVAATPDVNAPTCCECGDRCLHPCSTEGCGCGHCARHGGTILVNPQSRPPKRLVCQCCARQAGGSASDIDARRLEVEAEAARRAGAAASALPHGGDPKAKAKAPMLPPAGQQQGVLTGGGVVYFGSLGPPPPAHPLFVLPNTQEGVREGPPVPKKAAPECPNLQEGDRERRHLPPVPVTPAPAQRPFPFPFSFSMSTSGALDAPPLAPSSASADQALLLLPAPAISSLDELE